MEVKCLELALPMIIPARTYIKKNSEDNNQVQILSEWYILKYENTVFMSKL